jgi:hypothetical protein
MSVSIDDIRNEMIERPTKRPVEKVTIEVTTEPAADTFVPVRVWTAGPGMPQEDIYTEGLYGRLRPFRDGAYYCQTQKELDIAKKALGARLWLDNIPEDEEGLKCDICNWVTRSTRAHSAHLNHAHGRAQSG